MRYTDLKYLAVPLPEDLSKLKGYGDFERMARVIDLKLNKDGLPEAMRNRLLLEKEIIRLLPREYPYTAAEALAQLRERLGAFEMDELEHLRDLDAVEWAYINGEVKYKNNFLSNLVKTRKAYADRLLDKHDPSAQEHQRLYDAIALMRRDGALSMRFHVHAKMDFFPEPGREGQPVTAYLPLPIEYAQVKNFRFTAPLPDYVIAAPEDFSQRTAIYRGVPGKQPFEIDYTYETHMRYVKPDPAQVSDGQPTFYTEEYGPHIRFTPYLKWLAAEIVGDEKNPLVKARKIYDYITTKIIYSYMRAYMTMPMVPEYAAASMKGDCGVQALLFITLCRIVGVPARWQAGLYMNMETGSHDWAQFYVAPYGWLYADPSFGGSAFRAGDEARRDFYFGNLDPFRLPANSEYQHDFFVPTKFLRHDPYDNQQGEAEYQDTPLKMNEYDAEQTILSCEIIDQQEAQA